MNEKLIEKRLGKAVEKLGGIALKLFSVWFTGLPDRIVLMPNGRIYFAEMKSTGAKQSPRQKLVTKLLVRLGFFVAVIDTDEQLDEFLFKIYNDQRQYDL